MKKLDKIGMVLVVGFAVLILLTGCTAKSPGADTGAGNLSEKGDVKTFSSMAELQTYLEANTQSGENGYYDTMMPLVGMPAVGPTAMPNARTANAEAGSSAKLIGSSSGTLDYSQTNNQVAGVDEADFVKSDGHYIYMISEGRLLILRAYPAENGKILSETKIVNGNRWGTNALYLNGDDLIVFTNDGRGNTLAIQYDVSNRSSPRKVKTFGIDGSYFDSRMIGRYVYVIANKNAYCQRGVEKIGAEWNGESPCAMPPSVSVDGKNVSAGFQPVYYFDDVMPAYNYQYTSVTSINLDGAKQITNENETDRASAIKIKTYLLGGTSAIYVSQNNIYLTYTRRSVPMAVRPSDLRLPTLLDRSPMQQEETAIHRIAIKEGQIALQASGYVPGHVLNQFSMDEHEAAGGKAYFRIATTTGQIFGSDMDRTTSSGVYVLGSELERIGTLSGLAPGEKIYSARFMGNRAYLVTFKKVDPLFVIDLKNPNDPKVLGKLKIPGYSDYLHPYDENHLIGIGKDAIDSESGDFALYQGVKFSLFDVSDVEHPKEVAKYQIGDRGTDSYALQDHKAFLFDKERKLLVVPILLAEKDGNPELNPDSRWQYGEYKFQGAYVFRLDAKSGFTLRGRISHTNAANDSDSEFLKSGDRWYGWNNGYDVLRSMYIEDVLYTISDRMVKMNDLDTLQELKKVTIPQDEIDETYPMPYPVR